MWKILFIIRSLHSIFVHKINKFEKMFSVAHCMLCVMDYICEFTLEKSSEQLKDTKDVIRSRNSKVRQYNSQNNKDKKANSDNQNSTQKN